MMKRCAFLLILVAGIGFLQPVRALAGMSSFTCVVTRLNDKTYNGTDDIGMDNCENGMLTFSVRSPVSASYQKYAGSKCSTESNEDETCERVGSEDEVSGTSLEDEFEISVKELLDYYGKNCIATSQTVRIYIFPAGQLTGGIACTEIKVDTAGAETPTNVKGKPGEHQINITWKQVPSDADETYEYEVFYKVVDDCEGLLEEAADALAPAAESQASASDAAVDADAGTVDASDGYSALLELWDYDGSERAQGNKHTLEDVAEPGEELMISVATVDKAENMSPPSWPICVKVVETYGFCDSTDSCKDGCSVGPIGKANAHTGASVVVGLLSLLALIWTGRRSRR